MTLYLDTSVIIPLFVPEPNAEAVAALLEGHPAPLIVTDFAGGEFASALSRLVRIGRLSERVARDCLVDFDVWRLTNSLAPSIDPADVRVAGSMVRNFDLKLRFPDAVHAATCQRLGAVLVTLDRRLAAGALALGIAVTLPA